MRRTIGRRLHALADYYEQATGRSCALVHVLAEYARGLR